MRFMRVRIFHPCAFNDRLERDRRAGEGEYKAIDGVLYRGNSLVRVPMGKCGEIVVAAGLKDELIRHSENDGENSGSTYKK